MTNKPVQQNSTSNLAWIKAWDTETGKPQTGLTHATSNLQVLASKNGAEFASIGTLVTMTVGTWTTLGFKESTTNPGHYQIGVPNAQYDTVGELDVTARITSDDTVVFSVAHFDIASFNPTADNTTAIANAVAADAVTEIQNGLATAAALATVDQRLDTEIPALLAAVDTEVAAIKDVTDTLSLQAIGQELLLALAMGRGNRIVLDGSDLVLYGTDGVSEVSRQPFTRLPAPANPTATIG